MNLHETAVPRIDTTVRRSLGAADRHTRPTQITHTKARRARKGHDTPICPPCFPFLLVPCAISSAVPFTGKVVPDRTEQPSKRGLADSPAVLVHGPRQSARPRSPERWGTGSATRTSHLTTIWSVMRRGRTRWASWRISWRARSSTKCNGSLNSSPHSRRRSVATARRAASFSPARQICCSCPGCRIHWSDAWTSCDCTPRPSRDRAEGATVSRAAVHGSVPGATEDAARVRPARPRRGWRNSRRTRAIDRAASGDLVSGLSRRAGAA